LPIATVDVLPPDHLNTSAYLDLNDIARHSAWAHGFMHAWALWAGLAAMAALVAGAYLWGRRSARAPRVTSACLLAVAGAAIGFAVNQVIGHAAGELRPYVTHPHALVLVARTSDASFPSDHAVVAAAIAVGLFFVSWRWGLVGSLVALFLGFARVYVGAHYPGDVVAGLLLGAVIVVIVELVLLRVATRLMEHLVTTPLGPLVQANGIARRARHASTPPRGDPFT